MKPFYDDYSEEITPERIIDLMREMTDEQRMQIMCEFCTHCGRNEPRCQCWNDE